MSLVPTGTKGFHPKSLDVRSGLELHRVYNFYNKAGGPKGIQGCSRLYGRRWSRTMYGSLIILVWVTQCKISKAGIVTALRS
jgi:hypothetical protein